MKIFSIIGFNDSGKTTTLMEIIRELVKRGKKVNSIKSVHMEGFSIDTEGKDSWKHRKAGAQITAIRSTNETSIIIQRSLTLKELIPYFNGDYLALEGFSDEKIPKILCASNTKDLEERFDVSVIAISGVISEKTKEYRGIKVINGLTNIKELTDVVEMKSLDSKKFARLK